VTSSQSIPPAPTFDLKREYDRQSIAENDGVRAAYSAAKSKLYVAFGDKRQNFRPQIAFVAQYNRFATFNNYQDYYNHFQHNNFGIGISISFPIYDASRKAKAKESAADAAHAAAQADQARDQTSEQVTELQKSLAELVAQEEVAQLQSELAASDLETVTAQVSSGSSSPIGQPLTPRDEQNAHIQERQRYLEYLNSKFDLLKAELSLLRIVGSIEDWAKSSTHP